MKSKMVTFLIALSTISLGTFAQQKTPFFQFGVKGGANITKIEGTSFKDEFMYGYSLGGFVAIKVGEKWQIQPEVLFNQYTSKTADNFDDLNPMSSGNNLKDVKLNYLSIPVLLNFTPTKFFTLQAGPQYATLMDKSQTLLKNGGNAFKNGDFSLLGGIQLNFANFRVGGRYFIGLDNINQIDNQDKWRNQGFQLSLGLRII